MGLRDVWQRWQTQRATKYLQAHQQLALEALRRDPALGAQAFQAFLQMQAATDGPDRRSYAYPLFNNFGMGAQSPLARTVAKPTSWQLRAFAELPPARRAVNALTNPILDLHYAIAVRRPRDLRPHDVEPPPTADQQRRITAALSMLEHPNDMQSGREWLEIILEDLICLGACPFEVQPNRGDDRPLFLWPIEAETIRINARWTPNTDTYRYSQSRAYAFGSNAGTDEVKLRAEEVCYPKLNPRSHTPFGLGYLEVALTAVNAFVGSFDFSTRKASNATPSHALFLGENVTIDQVRQWQHYWENDVEGMGKTPILGGGRSPTVLSMLGTMEDPMQVKWQEWVVRIIAMSFGLSPMKLGLERDVNRNTASEQASSDWETVSPVAGTLKDAFTSWLLGYRLGWTDLEFQWIVKNADELKQAEVLALQYEANDITINELREVYERPPLEGGLGDLTKIQFETAVKMQLMAQQHEQHLEEQAAMPPPSPGQPAGRPRPQAQAASVDFLTPFGDVESLSPQESAFVKALMKQSRRERNGYVRL